MADTIRIRGARANNLKNVSLDLPRDRLIVFTGLSGSGKSSLAFDTLYAEGQRRYVESLSSYARQFLGQMDKPDVDLIEGLSPAISIDQKTTSHNPRSTVGTVTEIYDYLRLLWARVGVPHCPSCGREIRRQSVDQIVDRVLTLPEGTRFQVLSPVIRGKKGEHARIFESARKNGYSRVRVDGLVYDLSETIPMNKNQKHSIEVVVDRLVIRGDITRRLTDSVETALDLSDGLVGIHTVSDDAVTLYSRNYACEDCGVSLPEFSPRMFSFNAPYGACPECAGLGTLLRIDPERIVPNGALSIREGAVQANSWTGCAPGTVAAMYYEALSKKYGFSLDTPWDELPESVRQVVLYGTGDTRLKLNRSLERSFEGVIPNLERRYAETSSESQKRELEESMTASPCPSCGGKRLSPVVLAVTVGGLSIMDFCALSVDRELEFLAGLSLTGADAVIADRVVRELESRLRFLRSVGLQYLTLDRTAATLSGGESQRIRLATQIGSALTGVLYILDEPSIGLHQRDNARLLDTMRSLRDLGNTLVVVEHDEDTIRAADYLVDIGPGAGVHGGSVVAHGTLADILACPQSLTGQYLSGERFIPVPAARRAGNGGFLRVYGARENNLKGIDVSFPLGAFTCVTGVSGSGKSSLVNEIVYNRLAAELNRARTRPGAHDRMEGIELLDKVVGIDQSPIGRTPRSNPATYTGLFSDIRTLFAATTDARERGYNAGRFSFNVRGGRCEACAGDGLLRIEMNFLPDVYVNCDVCHGRRYNRETLEVRYKGKSIADVLDMTVDEALEFFSSLPALRRRLETLAQVGLGYIRLGQSSTTLSGGEAQRVKLAAELSRRATGRTVYILDEPTTGLHAADVHRLIRVLQALTDAGNTVIVIEHNLDVIKNADYLIDLGPEGGDAGGTLVACGTPEEVAACPDSFTGQFLAPLLKGQTE